MIYTEHQTSNSSRLMGASIAVVVVAIAGWGMSVGLGKQIVDRIVPTVTELITITPEPEIIPEPPKPVEAELPPPVKELAVETPDIELPPIETAPVAEFVADLAPVAPIMPEAPAAPAASTPNTSPSLRRASEPPYPSASIRAEEQGTTTLNLCIDAGGRVTSANVIGSSGFSRLDDAAARWIRNERFKPATLNGGPVQTCSHTIAYEWQLNKAR